MTIFEFFAQNTISQICAEFRKAGINHYKQIPSDVTDFCKKLNLEADARCKTHSITRSDNADLYVTLTFPNPQFPETPIVFDSHYIMETKYGKCQLSCVDILSFDKNIPIFKSEFNLFDCRKEYNTLEYNVWLFNLTSVAEKRVNKYDQTYLHLNEDATINKIYDAICEHVNGIAPLIRMFLQSVQDGSWEKTWNKFMPRYKWKQGHEPMKRIDFPLLMNDWYHAVKCGLIPNIADFIKYFGLFSVYHHKDEKRGEIIRNWNSKAVDVVLKFQSYIAFFDDIYLDNPEMTRWNETYRNANTELICKVTEAIKEVSKKYGINPDHLDYVTIQKVRGEINWFHRDIPNNAYLPSENS